MLAAKKGQKRDSWPRGGAKVTFHVAMQNVAVVEITQSFEELEHVALDLSLGEDDVGIGRHAGKIVVHVGTDHVQGGALLDIFCAGNESENACNGIAEGGAYSCDVRRPSLEGSEC